MYRRLSLSNYNHGQKSLGQSERNFNSMRITSSVFLQIHVPSPLPTQYNVERSKELCLDGLNTVCGVGDGVGTYSASSARVQFRVCYKAFELYNCPKTFVHDCLNLLLNQKTQFLLCLNRKNMCFFWFSSELSYEEQVWKMSGVL